MPDMAIALAKQVYDTLLELKSSGLSYRCAIRYGVLLHSGYEPPQAERNWILSGDRPPRLWEIDDNEMECEQPHGYSAPGLCWCPVSRVPAQLDYAMSYCDNDGNVLADQEWS